MYCFYKEKDIDNAINDAYEKDYEFISCYEKRQFYELIIFL